ncbi:hypothetical protein Vafri_8227, partial [Volvox africanus]
VAARPALSRTTRHKLGRTPRLGFAGSTFCCAMCSATVPSVSSGRPWSFYPPKLAAFHSSGRISEVMTKVYNSPIPMRSKAPGAPAAATPRAQCAASGGSCAPISLHLGKQLRRATVVQLRHIGRM